MVTDDHLSERTSFFVVTVGCFCVLKRKHAINGWPEPPLSYGPVHGVQLDATPAEDRPQRDKTEEKASDING